jgi:hypothetical protein
VCRRAYERRRPLDVAATLARSGDDHVLVAAIDADYLEN